MYIKRVAIQGFKTFAVRTEFIFDPGITAVVGPNGSGKSNIVDAVRWCLGEQSFSLLRSKKTSDVIFSGSDKRARLGMAQVSLTLDNSGGEIPLDFAEVEITRRAYRDGENEYLVNGQRVRLADVTELLAPTGLGKRTYAVIGQGLIDRVLSLAPEDRRSLFEEAAGITGYQIKRDTTLRRLEATETNLTRVRDITAELAPRLGYMRRQAERAREREQLAADLHSFLREWYGWKWHAALAEVEEQHAAAQRLEHDVQARQVALNTLGVRIEGLRGSQATVRAALGDLHRASSDLHRQAEGVGRALAVAQEGLRRTQDRREETARELAPLRVQGETLAARVQELESAAAQAAAALDERAAAVRAVQAALDAQQAERGRLAAALDGARARAGEIARRLADAQSRTAQAGERRGALDAEIAAQRASARAAEQEAATLAAALSEAEAAMRDLEAQAAAAQAELGRLEQERAAVRARLEQAEAARREADRAADRVQTRHDLLRRLQAEGAGYGGGVRAVLQANLPGVVGTVAALLRVPPHLDKAVETALGGALQNVVTETWAAAQSAIETLKRSGRGRATFLPLDRLHNLPPIRAPRNAPGILGNALDLVEYDARIAPAAEQMLNRVWVAEDLAAARRALDGLRDGPRPTVVTLGGEIVRPGGAVTGGSEGERRDDSVLARERELRELPAQVEAANQAAQQAAAACRTLAGEQAAAQAAGEGAQAVLAELARRERSQRAARDEAARRHDRAAQAARWQAERLAQLEAESGASQGRAAELEALLAALEAERLEAEAALERAAHAAAAAGGDDLLRALADRRAAAAEIEGALRSRRDLLEAQRRSLQSVIDQARAKEARAAALEDEAAALLARTEELAGQEEALRGELDGLRRRIGPDEARLAQLEAQQAAAETEERSLQAALRSAESEWSHAQLLLQRAEDVVYGLRGEIEHDLGLVAVEQSDELADQPPLPWDAFVEQLPVHDSVADGLEEELAALRLRLGRLGGVNPAAPQEFDEAAARYTHLVTQSEDLDAAAADLRKILKELDEMMRTELLKTFTVVAAYFKTEFARLFNGGTAELTLTDPGDITTSGIEITARPPGKRPQSLALLSGGERSLTACALIFAILRASPTPFCVLDEVDAALDEANVDRFRLAVEALSDGTQFIIVTHNRRTLEGANAIYGVTMGADGVSKVISLRLDGDRIVHHAAPATNGAPPADPADPADLSALEELVQM